jgi:cellulose synthase/poly-beta-1,6-N-acetylglucosamine synthase-like glycosyltransferase
MVSFGDALVYAVAFFGLYTAIFFSLTVFQGRKELTRQLTSWRPTVAIIVPCYNEETTVSKTVESLLNLDYPDDKLDIIVVDDGSEDNTLQIAKQYENQGVTVLHKDNGGKHTALNLGLEHTDADIAGALDADSFVEPEALKRMIPYFEDDDVMSVTPSLKIHKPDNWLQIVQMMEYLIGILLRKVFAMLGSVHVAPGPFTLYRTEFFREHGTYRKAYLTEDIEMALRIQDNQFQIENAPDAYVYTIGPPTFWGLYRQRLRWYYGFIQNVLDYKSLFSPNHGNLGLFVLPGAFISVLLVILMLGYTAITFLTDLYDRYVFLQAIEWDIWQMLDFNFDPFFISFNSTLILSFIVMGVSLYLLVLAKRVAGKSESIKYPYIVYVLTYWMLFGFWWAAAFYRTLTNNPTEWAHKSAD